MVKNIIPGVTGLKVITSSKMGDIHCMSSSGIVRMDRFQTSVRQQKRTISASVRNSEMPVTRKLEEYSCFIYKSCKVRCLLCEEMNFKIDFTLRSLTTYLTIFRILVDQ